MNTNRFSRTYVGLLVLAVFLVSVSFVTMSNSSKEVSGNTYLPLPPGKQTQLYNDSREARNLYHRPSSQNSLASTAVYSDYFERHPELSAKVASSVDLTDYYFRHLGR